MNEIRERLVEGTYINFQHKIIGHLYEKDTESTLAYIGLEQNYGFANNILLIVEYYPEKLCQRDEDDKLHVIRDSLLKEKYDNGLNEFIKTSGQLSSGKGDLSLGVLVHYYESNGTAYRIHNWKDGEYRKKLKEISKYADVPSGYFPPNSDDFIIHPEEIDMNSEPYSYLFKSFIDEHNEYKDIPLNKLPSELQTSFLFQLQMSIKYERDNFFDIITELDAFEQSNIDYSLGKKRKKITLDEVDKIINPSEWRELRLLLKPDDEFWEWFIPGESAGICLYRNGRGFKTWVTLKT